MADYDEAIRIDPNNSRSYTCRGNGMTIKGAYDQAIADYNKAIELNPKYSLAYITRGLAYRATGKIGQAIADYTQAIQLDPNSTVALVDRGYAFDLTHQYDKAFGDYNEALRLDPKNVQALLLAGAQYTVQRVTYIAQTRTTQKPLGSILVIFRKEIAKSSARDRLAEPCLGSPPGWAPLLAEHRSFQDDVIENGKAAPCGGAASIWGILAIGSNV